MWNVIAQQTIFAEVDFNPLPGSPASMDSPTWTNGTATWPSAAASPSSWGGPEGPTNPVVITGDIHSSWVNDVKVDYDDPSSPVMATEFVSTSISSDFPAVFIAPVNATLVDNPHIKDFDGLLRGYVVCRLDTNGCRSTGWWTRWTFRSRPPGSPPLRRRPGRRVVELADVAVAVQTQLDRYPDHLRDRLAVRWDQSSDRSVATPIHPQSQHLTDLEHGDLPE